MNTIRTSFLLLIFGRAQIVSFEHPTLQGVSYPLYFTTGRCPGLVAFAPSGRYHVITEIILFLGA